MAYRCWTHVALAVGPLPEAEEFYTQLFGMAVAFREAEVTDGWRTLREGAGWDQARNAGIDPGLSQLHRDGVVLALETADTGPGVRGLSHVGIGMDEPELAELRARAGDLGCHIVTDRDGLLVFDDPYGVRWEATTATALASTAARTGRWLDLPA
jgi:catechol 2,3-dioxygenase-like lactoylglutathione lyase family enzyme